MEPEVTAAQVYHVTEIPPSQGRHVRSRSDLRGNLLETAVEMYLDDHPQNRAELLAKELLQSDSSVTWKTCSKCHLIKPVTQFHGKPGSYSHYCKDCRRIYGKAYYILHKDEYRERCQFWKESNRQHYRAYQAAYHRAYYAKYRERIAMQRRLRHLGHSELARLIDTL
jgi:hypothetical protein